MRREKRDTSCFPKWFHVFSIRDDQKEAIQGNSKSPKSTHYDTAKSMIILAFSIGDGLSKNKNQR
jgi:hypothetical protein